MTAKRLMDLAIAVPGLLLAAPLMLCVALCVRLALGPGVLFRQERPGLHGQPFTILKFRTMKDGPGTDAERLTAFGRLLRGTSLDELPELLNVIRGDMSLVGPRPLLMRYLPRYSAKQARRHEVPPGITGWAQVNGRNALTWEERLALDVWYVDNRTLWLDLRILGRTLWAVLSRRGISAPGEATMGEFMGQGDGQEHSPPRAPRLPQD
ncbi:MAG: sugar transferase [Desulfovibrio sp.]|nr:sugar transferase [Desulfovibrio sp.]